MKISDGKTITAAVKAATASDVTFLMGTGKTVVYPLAKLTEESRKIIAAAVGAAATAGGK